jgi:hypothetical protein
MKIPLICANIDERFLDHRRRSTSLAAMAGAITTGGIWEYDWIARHFWNWELFSILIAMVVTKLAAMTWYHFTD